MSTVGNVNIRITADNSNAEKGIKQTKSSMSSLGKSVGDNAKKWAKWGAAAAAAAVAVGAALTKAAMTTVDDLAKTARSIDASIVGLQGLQLAAREAGVSQEAAASSAQMLNQRLGEAVRGTGEAAAQLERLGLNAAELQGMDVDQRFAAIAQRTRELGFNTSQTADALRNLGIRNRDMVLLMQQGGEDILNATNRVKDYGLELNEVDAAKVEQANDTFAFAADIIKNVFQRAAIEVAPIIQAIGERFLGSAKEAGGLGEMVGKVFDFMIEAIAKAASAIDGIIRAIKTIGNAFDFVVSGVTAAFAGLMRSVMRAIDNIVNGVISGVNALIRQLNRIPRVDISEIADSDLAAQAAQFFDNVGGAAVERMEDAWDRTQEVWAQPYAGDTVRSFVAESREMAETAAREAVEARNQVFRAAGVPDLQISAERAEGIEALSVLLRGETHKIFQSYQEQLGVIQGARDERINIIEQYNEKEAEILERKAQAESIDFQLDELRSDLEQRLVTLDEFNQKEAQLLQQRAQLAESEVDIEALRQARDENLAEIERYAHLEEAVRKEAIEKALGDLTRRFATEEELYQQRFASDLQRLQEARAQELLTEQEYQDKLTSLTREAADRRSQIAESERQARIGILQSMLGNMTSLMNTGSRKMFEIGKAAAVANALVQGREAIVSSYAAGARIGGPPVGAAFAATAAAATASQIAQVRSSSFSSGGAASAGTFDQGLGAIRTAQAGPQQPQQVAQISISGGDFFSRDTVMGLMNQIQQLSQDGVRFQIAGGG